jgi:putative tricarboxylic transport membrane protein
MRSAPAPRCSLLALAALTGLTGAHAAAQQVPELTIVAPAAPGGGWDQLAREMERELEASGLAGSVQVENVPGAAGTIGLAQFINTRRGDGDALLVSGLVMLGAILWNESPVSMTRVTPIARLTGEYEVVAVPASSPHTNMESLVRALRENPAAVSWGGGSAGGTDHILAGLIVAAAEVDPGRTNYIAFSGGGEAVTALLGGQVTAGISGYSEFAPHIQSGRLRAIALSAPDRVPGLDVPTLSEQGLDVVLENWRAVLAPPGLRPSEREALARAVEDMAHTPSWGATLSRLGWTDSYLDGPAFEEFLDDERLRIASIVSQLRAPAGNGAGRMSEWAFPLLVLLGAVCVVASLLLRRRAETRKQLEARGDAGERLGTRGDPGAQLATRGDAGEHASRSSLARVTLGLAAFVALLDLAGFVVAGTVLFASAASASGSRRWLRDVLVGFALCAAVYVLFVHGLGVSLPAGLALDRL